ncbi:MAG: hypothetical protein ACK4VZ_07460 [Paracoccaceae bacterium]
MDQLSIGNCHSVQRVAKSGTAQQWNQDREHAHRVYANKLEDITNAAASGKRVNHAIRNFLGNPKVRLSAALRALGGQPGPKETLALWDQINCWATNCSPVFWYPKRKSSGGTRPICVLPPTLKAKHYMLASVIGALLPDTETLFGIPGRGIADALVELKALQCRGFSHLAKTDIVNCFQSIDPDTLFQLPLPMEVIRQTLDHRNLTFTRDQNQFASQAHSGNSSLVRTQHHNASGPSGLLQGSPASGIILARLLQGIPTSENARVMICFDNIVVTARTAHQSRAMMTTLTAYFAASPAGPLALCPPTYADNEPLEFLGGLFDPARQDIGIAHGTLSRLERWLDRLEVADREHQAKVSAEHRENVARNAIYGSIDPFREDYPTAIWQALKDIVAGMPFLETDCPELTLLLDTAAETVNQRGNAYTSLLHQNLIAPDCPRLATAIRTILKWAARRTQVSRR